MFDIGFWELAIIFVVALMVIGPDKLPGVARSVGTWVGRARRFVNNVKGDVERELRAEEMKQALERDASLDELKQIMNTERFSLEEEDEKPAYQVSAIEGEPGDDFDDDGSTNDEQENATIGNDGFDDVKSGGVETTAAEFDGIVEHEPKTDNKSENKNT